MERTERDLNTIGPQHPELYMVSAVDMPDKPLRELTDEELRGLVLHLQNDMKAAQQLQAQGHQREMRATSFISAATFELERRAVQRQQISTN